MFLSLTLTCVLAGALLATVNDITQAPISAAKKEKLNLAIKEVAPQYNNSPTDEAYMSAISAGDSLKIYPAKWNGELVGAAVESNSNQGFSGMIKVIVGLDAEGKLLNYKVLEHAETPGLGSKMEDWFRAANHTVVGKNLATTVLKVSKDDGDIDAITAATISSRAFLNAVNRAYMAFSGKTADTDSATEATTSASGKVKH